MLRRRALHVVNTADNVITNGVMNRTLAPMSQITIGQIREDLCNQPKNNCDALQSQTYACSALLTNISRVENGFLASE